MGLRIKLITFVLGVLFLGVVLRNVRQNTFRPVYAVLWLFISAFLLSVALLEPLYRWIATSLIGINDARHIIYIALIGFLLVYNLYLTAMVSRMSNQIRELITQTAILENKAAKSERINLNDRNTTPSQPSAMP
ncbi:MAG: DUF2304 domain-containing protein [Verrucomicrobiia bacterium]|jgi:hypothetical protein